MSSSIQIYNDPHVSQPCYGAWARELREAIDPNIYKIEELKPHSHFDERNTSLILIPGGYAPRMTPGLKSLSEQVMKAVNHNAAFLGSCAGTVVASTSFQSLKLIDGVVSKNIRQNCSSQSDLPLNDLLTHLPYYTPGGYTRPEPQHRTSVEVDWLPSLGNYQSKACHLFHAMGPCFPLTSIPENRKYEYRPLAMYNSEGNVPLSELPAAAILNLPENKKPRLYTGIHPEIGMSDLELMRPILGGEIVDKLKLELEPSEKIRVEMVHCWLSELQIKLIY